MVYTISLTTEEFSQVFLGLQALLTHLSESSYTRDHEFAERIQALYKKLQALEFPQEE